MTNLYVFKTKKKKIADLYFKGNKVKCFVGANGIGNKAREGDRITPRGVYKLEKVFYRSDRIAKFKTNIPNSQITKNSFWCVDSNSCYYNQYSNSKNNFECETLFRGDCLYDVFITLNYNVNPVKKYRGSAIFLHCFEKKTKFTEGCVAVPKHLLIEIAKQISPSSKIIII